MPNQFPADADFFAAAKTPPVVLAVTGASGIIYAARFLERAVDASQSVALVVSQHAKQVISQEFPTFDALVEKAGPLVRYYSPQQYAVSIASGSRPTSGMAVLPCSVATLGAIASGAARNLIHRAAEVHLKERRKLVLVVRETPLSLVAIENLRTLTLAGAIMMPAVPAFYNNPTSIEDLADFLVDRVWDQLFGE